MIFARALRRILTHSARPHPASSVSRFITLSGGITTCIPDGDTTVESMVTRADEALYAAKARGRDRFFSFEMQLNTVEQLAL